jgi:tetratricopeptide (TPR) repeat protein
MNTPARLSRGALSPVALLWVTAIVAAPLGAQELALKRAHSGVASYECPRVPRAPEPSLEQRTQAMLLASSAATSVVLGDADRARDLLVRATGLDPASADLLYRLARVHDDLDEHTQALAEYCRALSMGTTGEEARFARERIAVLIDLELASIPEAARTAFERGVSAFDRGRLADARRSFALSARAAPTWPLAHYNEGVTLAALGSRDEAVVSLRRYIERDPEAEDVLAVSERIGQLQGPPDLGGLSPGAVLTLGMFMPGLAHYSSGRPLRGAVVTSLAAGALAAGLLVQKRAVRCLVALTSEGGCPTGEIAGVEMSRPYATTGLAVALGVSVLGALDAYFGARGRSRDRIFVEARGRDIGWPSISSKDGAVQVSFLSLPMR